MTHHPFNAKIISDSHTHSNKDLVMKKFIVLLALVSSSAFAVEAAPLAFNQMFVKKASVSEVGIHFVTNRTVKSWCTGTGSPMSIGSFEAAQAIDALADGLYSCEGKFVQVPGERSNAIQIFEIGNCSLVNAVDLQTSCPTPAPKK
jgi:hypothetical protein